MGKQGDILEHALDLLAFSDLDAVGGVGHCARAVRHCDLNNPEWFLGITAINVWPGNLAHHNAEFDQFAWARRTPQRIGHTHPGDQSTICVLFFGRPRRRDRRG